MATKYQVFPKGGQFNQERFLSKTRQGVGKKKGDRPRPVWTNQRSSSKNNCLGESSNDDDGILQDFKGALYKRKDFLDKEEAAKSHPNRTYYYRKNVDLDKLIQLCSKKLRDDPKNLKAFFIRASSWMKKKEYQRAINDYTSVISVNSKDVVSLYNRGTAYEKLGRTDESIRDYTAVLDLDPNHVNAAYARAACHNRRGHFARAIEDYNLALRKDRQKNDSSDKLRVKGSPGYKRTGSFAVGMEEYMKRRELELRQKIGSSSKPVVDEKTSSSSGLGSSKKSGTSSSFSRKPTTSRSRLHPAENAHLRNKKNKNTNINNNNNKKKKKNDQEQMYSRLIPLKKGQVMLETPM